MTKLTKVLSKAIPQSSVPAWVKFKSLSRICFVGQDAIAFGADQHILLANYETKSDIIYIANSEENGEGVSCIAGHAIFPLFAFAETRPSPRIFVISYPELGKVSILKKNDETPYKSICFSETEHLIALTSAPHYMIQVWYWRSNEMLVDKQSLQSNTVQILGCGTTLPPTVCQLSPERSNLVLWELHGTVKLCKLVERRVNLDAIKDEAPLNYTFAIDGTLYIVTKMGHVYHVYGPSGLCNLSFKWDGDCKGYFPCITSFPSGIIISGPDGVLRSYRKIKGIWSEQWKLKELGPFIALGYNQTKDSILGTTFNGAVYILQPHEDSVSYTLVKEYDRGIEYFAFLKPLDDFVVTVNAFNILQVWKLRTGEKLSSLILHSHNSFCNHPTLGYLILGDTVGILHLINIVDVFNPKIDTTYFLTHYKIQEMAFSSEGDYLAVSDCSGDIFILKTSMGNIMEVIQHFPENNFIRDLNFFSEGPELTLMGLIIDPTYSMIASNRLFLISISYDNTEIYSQNEIPLPEYLTSISPVFASDSDFYGAQYQTKQIKVLRLSGSNVREIMNLNTEHQLRYAFVNTNQYHVIFSSIDGQVHIFQNLINRKMTVLKLHNRFFMGVKQAAVDKFGQYLITLGHSGTLVCTKLNIGSVNTKLEDDIIKQHQAWKQENSQKITEGFILEDDMVDQRWLDIQQLRQKEKEEELYKEEKDNIKDEFERLRQKIKDLIDNNQKVPQAEKVELDSFNIAVEWTKIKAEEAEDQRNLENKRMDKYIQAQTNVNQAIIEKCWQSMEMKGCQIRGIFTKINVENYPLPTKPVHSLNLKNVMTWRKLEIMASSGDEFHPWTPIPANQLEQLLSHEPDIRNPNIKDGIDYLNLETVLNMTGTSSFKFIDVVKLRHQQINIVALHQIHEELIFGHNDLLRLRQYFNSLFNQLRETKETEMGSVVNVNKRLRHIKSEIKELAKLKKIEIDDDEMIKDPIIYPQERPDTIIQVEDDEVEVLKYITPSQQKILDQLATEKERLRLEMLADDFRDRALMTMMDGVLEHKWEDEIKKPVWKPSCMLEKDQRDYDESDYEAVKDYHNRVKRNLIERDKYRDMLLEERAKLKTLLKDRITNFNHKVAKLQLLKIQVDSCINAEEMRLLKALTFSYQRIRCDRQEHTIRLEIETIRKQLTYLADTHAEIQEKIVEFKNNYESISSKDRMLDKQFKANFSEVAPIAVVDPAYKIFKRRPKYQIRAWATVPILLDLAKRIVSKKTHEQGALLLPMECVEYMNLLDQMDTFTGATGIDQNVWQILCRMRRAKIESEFKVKAFGLQLAEVDTTANAFNREMHHKRNFLSSLETKLDNLLDIKQKESMNRQLQLVLKRGQIEVNLAGHLSDFKDCVLIHKADIYEINEVIKKAGMKKLKAMSNAAVFRRRIIAKEWEHKVLRLTVRDLKDFLQVVEKCKITKEVQMWLKRKEMGWAEDLGQSAVEVDIQNTIACQEKILSNLVTKIKDVDEQIMEKRKDISKQDRKIQDINLDIAEQRMKRDIGFEETEHKSTGERMDYMAERSRLIRKIQEQHSQILEFSTLLELQKLRTFPTLTISNNVTKFKTGN